MDPFADLVNEPFQILNEFNNSNQNVNESLISNFPNSNFDHILNAFLY